MYSEFFSFLSNLVGFLKSLLCWFKLVGSSVGTALLVDPSTCGCSWLQHHCLNLCMLWEVPFLCKLSCALISLPFFLYASLSACSTPGRVLHTSTVMGYRSKFTQNSKMHLGIVKRFSPTIGIKWELYNAVITQMLFFFLTVYTIYRFLNQPWMVMDGSLYPTCCSLRPSHYATEAQKNKQNITWWMRNTKRIIRKIMQPYLKCIHSNSFSILKKTRRGSWKGKESDWGHRNPFIWKRLC